MPENVSIKEQLRLLLELQKLDTHIIALRKEKQDSPRELEELEQRFNNEKQQAENTMVDLPADLLIPQTPFFSNLFKNKGKKKTDCKK